MRKKKSQRTYWFLEATVTYAAFNPFKKCEAVHSAWLWRRGIASLGEVPWSIQPPPSEGKKMIWDKDVKVLEAVKNEVKIN